MDLYSHIDRIVALLIQATGDSTLAWLTQEAPAQAGRFWTTDPRVALGISWAQTAAATISAMFVFVIVVATLRKKALAPSAINGSAEVGGSPAEALAKAGGALRERWNEVLAHLDSPREAEWKVAVMEADKLIDDAMAKAGFAGGSFGDRLTNIQPGALISLDGLWWAHKVRNRLAHEMDYFLRYTEARQAVAYYEQALAELQLI